jgi:hypothetical protein
MWVLVGASPTGLTLNGQPDIEDFKSGSTGEKPSAPSESGYFKTCALPQQWCTWNQEETSLVTGGDRFPAWLVIEEKQDASWQIQVQENFD